MENKNSIYDEMVLKIFIKDREYVTSLYNKLMNKDNHSTAKEKELLFLLDTINNNIDDLSSKKRILYKK